jgi:alpha-mannosidase
MRISGVTSTELFRGTAARPLQVILVHLVNDGSSQDAVTVRVDGPAVSTPEPEVVIAMPPGSEHTAEVGVEIAVPAQPGSTRQVQVTVTGPGGSAGQDAAITVAETGWVMWMVAHFHYDPVWWSTQGQFL